MNKKTQTIIGVVAVAGLAYMLYKKSKKDKVFANAVGKASQRKAAPPIGPALWYGAPECSSGCSPYGYCKVNQYANSGFITSTAYYACTGTNQYGIATGLVLVSAKS